MTLSMRLTIVSLAAACAFSAAGRQNWLRNGSFENGPGPGGLDPRQADQWTYFGGNSIERNNNANFPFASGPGFSLKIFGTATTVGAYQDIMVVPGEQVVVSTQAITLIDDAIGGDAEAKLKIEFRTAGGLIEETEIVVLDATSMTDVWTPASIGPLVAPAGAEIARIVLSFTYTTMGEGSAYFDAASLTVNGGPNELDNPEFEDIGVLANAARGINDFTGFNLQAKNSGEVPPVDGNFVVRVDANTTQGFCGIYQDIVELSAGDRLFAQAWVRDPNGIGLNADAAAAIKLEFSPAGNFEIPPPVENLAFDGTQTVEVWHQVSTGATVPAGVTGARIIMLMFDESAVTGPVYCDDAVATRNGGANVLLNPSFETGAGGFNGITNWTEFNTPGQSQARKTGERERTGSFGLKLSGAKTAGLFQEIIVAPGETLNVSGWFLHRNAPPTFPPFTDPNCPACAAGVKIEWLIGGIPNQVDILGAPNNTVLAAAPNDTWLPIWIDYTMAPGTNARVRWTCILGRYGANSATVYFDAGEAVVLNFFNGADVDADDDQDLADFAGLQSTFRGSGGGRLWNGITYDNDSDNDVDAADWNFFQPRWTAPN